jgi:hypothetical protein
MSFHIDTPQFHTWFLKGKTHLHCRNHRDGIATISGVVPLIRNTVRHPRQGNQQPCAADHRLHQPSSETPSVNNAQAPSLHYAWTLTTKVRQMEDAVLHCVCCTRNAAMRRSNRRRHSDTRTPWRLHVENADRTEPASRPAHASGTRRSIKQDICHDNKSPFTLPVSERVPNVLVHIANDGPHRERSSPDNGRTKTAPALGRARVRLVHPTNAGREFVTFATITPSRTYVVVLMQLGGKLLCSSKVSCSSNVSCLSLPHYSQMTLM